MDEAAELESGDASEGAADASRQASRSSSSPRHFIDMSESAPAAQHPVVHELMMHRMRLHVLRGCTSCELTSTKRRTLAAASAASAAVRTPSQSTARACRAPRALAEAA